MTQGSATPSAVSAIFVGTPGRYGIIANAAPPRATLTPPIMPRATRLDVPSESRRCEYQPAASIATALPPAGNAPKKPIELCARPSPLIRNAPCHESASDRAQLAPKAADQHPRIVGFSSN